MCRNRGEMQRYFNDWGRVLYSKTAMSPNSEMAIKNCKLSNIKNFLLKLR